MPNENKSGALESLKIPLNLKSAYRPFVLNPSSSLNEVSYNPTSIKGPAQEFSFKSTKDPLGILPNSWGISQSQAMDDDISLKLIYGMDFGTGGMLNKGGVKLKDHILNHIPSISIREYQQDSKLNMLFSLIGGIKDGFQAGVEAAKGNGTDGVISSLKKTMGKWWDTFKWILEKPEIFLRQVATGVDTDTKYLYNIKDEVSYASILKIPNILYYKLISSLTLNVFQLPFNGEFVREADGHNGWTTNSFGTPSFTGAILSNINPFINNIKISVTPTWEGASSEEGTTIDFTVNLFNDSADQACVNYIFVNTILPGAMFTQYHIFQQSPSLFDIKVDGLGRFFMCSGHIKVEYKGVVRQPSAYIINQLATTYLNPMYKGQITTESLRKSGMVKIPDIYQITFQFKSLLPNNFNNYLYSHCANQSISSDDGKLYKASAISEAGSSLKKTLDEIAGALENGEEPFKSAEQKNAEEAMAEHDAEVERMMQRY